jgi:hypothetical protein
MSWWSKELCKLGWVNSLCFICVRHGWLEDVYDCSILIAILLILSFLTCPLLLLCFFFCRSRFFPRFWTKVICLFRSKYLFFLFFIFIVFILPTLQPSTFVRSPQAMFTTFKVFSFEYWCNLNLSHFLILALSLVFYLMFVLVLLQVFWLHLLPLQLLRLESV